MNSNDSAELAGRVKPGHRRTFGPRNWRYVPGVLAIATATVFVLVAAYRIHLPGLYMDEVDFVNAARGGPDNTMIYKRLGSVPLLVMPYIGALKAWIYAPVFWLFGVSPLTIRLPAILIAALTLLIFFQLMQSRVGNVWAIAAVWLMAIDPVNLFTSRLDWGPTVLMHFFQAALLAFWFSYRKTPKLWKLVLICVCAGLGFFDKFNFIWLIVAFALAVALCYPETLKNLWVSSSTFLRAVAGILLLIGIMAALLLILPLLQLHGANLPPMKIGAKWAELLSTLAGTGVAYLLFDSDSWIVSFVPFWLIVTNCYLALAALLFIGQDAEARENRRHGLFLLLISFFIFLQIVVTPQAGGPHHYSMIFPLPILAFVFLAHALYRQIATKNLRRFAAVLSVSVAVLVSVINLQNLGAFLSRLRTDSHYDARWSPEIYSLSRYVNKHGSDAKNIISVDWGLHNQLHALAPRELQQRMRDRWPTFLNLNKQSHTRETDELNVMFPEGKTLALTFAASKETFPDTRKNFLRALAHNPELKAGLLKEFWYDGEKIYEVYEVERSPRHTANRFTISPAEIL